MNTVVLPRPDHSIIEVNDEEDVVAMSIDDWHALQNATRAALDSGAVTDEEAEILKNLRVVNFTHAMRIEEVDENLFEVENFQDATQAAFWFARALTAKFPQYTFYAMPGSVNVRIVRDDGREQVAYCFVRKSDGGVYKAASWTAPSRDKRYSDVRVALRDADPQNAPENARKRAA